MPKAIDFSTIPFCIPDTHIINRPLIDLFFSGHALQPLPNRMPPKPAADGTLPSDFLILTLQVPSSDGLYHDVSRTEAVEFASNP
jgi:hypothetical protein